MDEQTDKPTYRDTKTHPKILETHLDCIAYIYAWIWIRNTRSLVKMRGPYPQDVFGYLFAQLRTLSSLT